MGITALLLPDEVEDRRTEPRYRIRLAMVPVDLCHDTICVNIHEVSATGLLLHSEKELPEGSILLLELVGTNRKVANVVWARERLHGVEFAKPLTFHQLQELQKLSTVVWPRFRRGHHAISLKSVVDPKDSLCTHHQDIADQEKLPISQRLGIIFGSTFLLWAAILGGAWLIAG